MHLSLFVPSYQEIKKRTAVVRAIARAISLEERVTGRLKSNIILKRAERPPILAIILTMRRLKTSLKRG